MARANAIGIGLGFLVAIYAVMIGMAGAPEWGLIVLAMVTGFYWAFGRRLFFRAHSTGRTASDVPVRLVASAAPTADSRRNDRQRCRTGHCRSR